MTPTDEDLARQLAERCDECGFIKDGLVCTQPKNHDGAHRGQPIKKVIPFR